MSSIFINYRKGDEENVAALLEQGLSNRFEPDVFFRAGKSIRLGDNFEEALMTAVRQSAALLAVIGPRWLSVCDKQGRRKIDKKSDWVRREILEAFRNRVQVIPILVGDVQPLRREDLPAKLGELAVCQYTRLTYRDPQADLDRLARELARLVPELHEKGIVPAEPAGQVNVARDNARVGMQGTVVGNVDFGNPRMTQDDRGTR